MLVLSRKREQAVMIGHNVRIVVLSVKGDTVKLGIKAPLEIPVVRPDAKERK